MKQAKYISKQLFIFMLMVIIGSLGAGCNACKKEEKKEDKNENDDVVITDAMLESVEAAIKDPGKGANYNFLLDILKNLKEKKSVDINATDANVSENTALIYAAGLENADIVKILIKKGADVNKKNKYGSFPLAEAAFYGNKQVVQALLEAPGIDINATYGGQTALYVAAEQAHKDIVLLLLNAPGIDITKVYNDGGTSRTARNIATRMRYSNSAYTQPREAIYDGIIAELTKRGCNP